MASVNDIRKTFLNYFTKESHKAVESSSLVPQDSTLLFTNSGMVQFKNIFTGVENPTFKRATTAQKCVRAGGKHNDLDNVGYTARHHTFFEMLGNFSFGDYFKDDAINFAWQLLTKEFQIPKEKLLVTIYKDDDEAHKIWKKVAGLHDDKIIRIATNDNFWMMGDTGPCGPCSEIFYDHGEKIAGGVPGSANEDGDRFIEIWNLVFMQFETLDSGERIALPKPSIDTGMGLERFSAIMQNKHNNYDIDLFQNIIADISNKSGIAPNPSNIQHFRVIADHLRSSSFLIADGVTPSNEGRGYVLRRIMRRAMRHAHTMGVEKIFMPLIVDSLVKEMGGAYPELVRTQALIKTTQEVEEIQFRKTLANGIDLLEKSAKDLKSGDVLNGEVAFKLYDTYGFSLDLTQDIMRGRGISVNEEEFEKAMQVQKDTSRLAWVGSGDSKENPVWFNFANIIPETKFVGYQNLTDTSKIIKITNEKTEEVTHLGKANKGYLIFESTPFYAESGGQVADTGLIKTKSGVAKVLDVQKRADAKLFVHYVEVLEGTLNINDTAELEVDKDLRKKIMAHHSSAHLLQYALRKVLGEHVLQKGSLNTPTYIRFDFSHNKPVTADEIQKIEAEVNKIIAENYEIKVENMQKEDAINKGAMALFGEKYGSVVRTITMGQSFELCGGTHALRTGDLAMFKIISEESIASGVRRIEAKVGEDALKYIWKEEEVLNEISALLTTGFEKAPTRIRAMLEELKTLKKSYEQLQLKQKQGSMKLDVKEQNGKILATAILENVDGKELKMIAEDVLKKQGENAVICLASKNDDKVSIIILVGKALNVKALNLLQSTLEHIDAKGGGGDKLAQGSGSKPSGIAGAFEAIWGLVI